MAATAFVTKTFANTTTDIKEENVTQNNTVGSDYFLSNEWMKYQAVVIVLWICSAYLLATIVVFELRQKRIRYRASIASASNIEMVTVSMASSSNARSSHPHNASPASASTRRRRRQDECRIPKDLTTRLSLSVATLFLFLHCNNILVELHLGWKSATACVATFQCAILFYAFAIAGVYIMLWDRQRRLYQAQALKHLTNGILRKVSAATLVVTVVLSLASLIILNLSAAPYSSSKGCYREATSLPRWVRVAVLPVLGIAQQIMLLGLVIYPLMKHVSSQSPATAKSAAAIRTLVKRLAICTGCCVFSDIFLIVILQVVANGNSSGLLGQMLTNFNLFINVLCLCFSFASWKERLFMGTCQKHN